MNLIGRLGLEGDSGVGDGGQSPQQFLWNIEFLIQRQKMAAITSAHKYPEVMDLSQLKTVPQA